MPKVEGVLIAGGGPVGLTTAVALAKQGIPTTVLEAGDALSTESRASTFHPSSLQILEELGVVQTLLEQGVVVPLIQFRERTGGLIAELDYSLLRRDTPFPFRIQFEQHKLTPLLFEQLRMFDNATVLFQHRVESVAPSRDSVTVTASLEGRSVTFEAPFVVGADGAGSAVRKSIGIGFEGITYPERYLVISTELDFSKVFPDCANVMYFSDPHEWFALIRTPDHWRATFPLRDDQNEEVARTPEAIQALMHGISPTVENYPIVHTNLYRVHRRVADRFVRGRVLLAGDAAHVNNPLGGLGMNSGILDGYFLAGHLAAVLREEAPTAILDEYGRRHRHMAVDVVGAHSNYNWVALGGRDETGGARQRAELAEVARDHERLREHLQSISLLKVLWELRATQSVATGYGFR